MIRLGVDFGTANTVVSYWDEMSNSPEVLRLEELDQERPGTSGLAQFVIPSVSAYRRDREAAPIFGSAVPPGADADSAVQVFRYTKSVAMNRVADIEVPIFGGRIRPREAAAEFLKTVINSAQLKVADPETEFVLTAPIESFDDYRDWLNDRVVDPSISSVRIVDEATAAAAGYAYKLSADEKILIFDFGAGTLDVTVVAVEKATETRQSGVRVIAKRGANLGGKHIDQLMMKWCLEEWRIPLADPRLTKEINLQLVEACEKVKVDLSTVESSKVEIVHPDTNQPLSLEITRSRFDRLLKENDIIRKTNMVLHDTLLEANNRGVGIEQIGAVFMVGGTSLIPRIQDVVTDTFPIEKVKCDSPLEAVARGAASIAGGFEATDHIQHEYAIRHIDSETGMYSYMTVVKQGTEFPTSGSIFRQTVQATYEGQTQLGIQIFEVASSVASESASEIELQMDGDGGMRLVQMTKQRREERRMSHLNESSPTFLEAHPPAASQQDRFTIDFEIDGMRRLTVTAYDLLNNKYVLTNEPVVRLA